MSGGTFNYNQYRIEEIANEIGYYIGHQTGDDIDDSEKYSEEVILEMVKGYFIMRAAYIYAQRIDWLIACDDGEENFLKRLKNEKLKVFDGFIDGFPDGELEDVLKYFKDKYYESNYD
jgi:hypothetical protein